MRCLERELELAGHRTSREKGVSITYRGMTFNENLRYDLLVDDCLLIEAKSCEKEYMDLWLLEIRFREIIGCGVNAFIVDRRLDHYRKQLLASKQSASSVARACGFSDMPYLTRIFKTKFNCTPGSLLGSASAKVTRPN